VFVPLAGRCAWSVAVAYLRGPTEPRRGRGAAARVKARPGDLGTRLRRAMTICQCLPLGHGLGVDLVVLRGKTDANRTGLRHCRAIEQRSSFPRHVQRVLSLSAVVVGRWSPSLSHPSRAVVWSLPRQHIRGCLSAHGSGWFHGVHGD
jgi:hypothetical protein